MALPIIVMGGSSGALQPMQNILGALPADLPAAVFAVLHLPPYAGTGLLEHLGRSSLMKVEVAQDGAPIERGKVVFAPPDHHLIIKSDHLRVMRTPRENLWRPSVDVLFRSAAVAHDSQVAAVILSGALDDGSAGLAAVKRCGGVAIVQSPREASVASMPECAIRHTQVDHVLEADAIAPLLRKLSQSPARQSVPVPEDLVMESRFAESGEPSLEINQALGELTEFSCSECSGPLWKRHGDTLRFRCLTGHALTARSLDEGLVRSLDGALWAAIRQFEQRANLCNTMAADERSHGRDLSAAVYEEREKEARAHARAIRRMLQGEPRE